MKNLASLVRVGLVSWLITAGFFFCVVKPYAQTQDTLNERYASNIDTLKSEVSLLRGIQSDARLHALEDTVVEVKWLGRTAASVLLGQLLISILSNRKKP